VILRILLAALLLQAGAASNKASIEGVVLRQGTNEPLADVRVSLSDHENPVVTKEDGKFSFKNIDPVAAPYRLIFAANGYVRREYGSLLDLTAGQAVTGLVVRLTPTGSVTGRLQDSDNKPLSGVMVHLLRAGYDASGKRVLRRFGTAQTNDLGEYRLYFLTPGTYSLSAAPLPAAGDLYDPGNLGRNGLQESFAPAVYPRPIEVQPGVTTRGIDLTLQRQQRFRVRGRIVDSITGQAPPQARVALHFRDPATGEDRWLSNRGDYENGAFEVHGVIPGSYSVSATVDEPWRFGLATVSVLDSDVNGVSISVKPGATISGRVRGEGGEPKQVGGWNISTGGPPQGARLTPYADDPRTAPPGLPSPVFSRLDEATRFRVFNLMPGEYVFSIPWLRDEFVKEAWFGAVDVLNRPLRFTGSEAGSLDIVVSSKMGAIEGKAATGAQVVLVPDRRDRTANYRAVIADQDGRFRIPRIVPGDYKLFAWEAIEPYGYFDPELLRRSEIRSVPVKVGESSQQTVELP
jgi:hypothetical protein